MSISGRIGLVSIVLWIVSIWLISGNEPLGLYLMIAALFSTIVAVLWPDWPGARSHTPPADRAEIAPSDKEEKTTESNQK